MALTKVIGDGLGATNDLTVDTTTLTVDATNNRVGIGTASPSNKFEVDGGSAETRLRVSTTGTDANEAGIILANSSKSADNDGIEISHGGGYTTFSGLTGTEYMRITGGTGLITQPLQPAFNVNLGATNSSTLATDGSALTLAFNTERFDNNADFASNTFTAPITGKYLLSLHLRINDMDSAANYYIPTILTSNQAYRTLINPKFSSDVSYIGLIVTIIADMDASDTCTVTIQQSGGSAQSVVEGTNDYTYFSGYLLG
tara:strand:+ start:75 stop:848 length:774 start_codon:yes stop_codon:yes gene_type:complete